MVIQLLKFLKECTGIRKKVALEKKARRIFVDFDKIRNYESDRQNIEI